MHGILAMVFDHFYFCAVDGVVTSQNGEKVTCAEEGSCKGAVHDHAFNFSLSLLTECVGYSSSKWRRYGKKYICVSRIYRSCFKHAHFSAQVAYLHCTTKLTLYIQGRV